MKGNDRSRTPWRKSRYSNGQANCVEVAELPGGVAVRDSKDPEGARLVFSAGAWRSFTASVQAGALRRR